MELPAADLRHILSHTAPLWEELRGQRLFITGGTGFFGCWLLESFATANREFSLGAEAVVLTRDPAGFAQKAPHLASHSAIRFFQGDVTGFPFPKGEFSHIVHAATTSGAPVSDEEMRRTIVAGTERVLSFATASRARKLLFTSSGAVYGRQPPEVARTPETFLPAPGPANAYADGKRAAERLFSGANDLEVKIARCFAFVGPHLPLDAHFAIGNFLRDGLAGVPIQVQGDGTPYRSYLYAADLAIWLWTILFRGQPDRPYNVGSEHAVSIRELAQTAGRMFNVPVTIAREADPAVPPARYVPDCSRAENELGLRASVPLGEAVQRTADWHRARKR